MDINNIRRVIHIGVPHTIEEYFQEAGRCGRDGLPASSTIYYNSYDLVSSKNITVQVNELVKAEKCKSKIIFPYSQCTDYIQQGSQPDNLVMLCKYFCVYIPLEQSIS